MGKHIYYIPCLFKLVKNRQNDVRHCKMKANLLVVRYNLCNVIPVLNLGHNSQNAGLYNKSQLHYQHTCLRAGFTSFSFSSKTVPNCWPALVCQTRNSSSSAPPPPHHYTRGTHYRTLGVGEDATADEIKKAFYTLSKRCHPDLYPGDEAMSNKFKDLSAAYEILRDKSKRLAYDAENGIRPGPRTYQFQSGYRPVANISKAQWSYTSSKSKDSEEKLKARRARRRWSQWRGDGQSDWIQEQQIRLRKRMEDEEEQYLKEWEDMKKEMQMEREIKMKQSVAMSVDAQAEFEAKLTAEEKQRWQEFQAELALRREAHQRELAFQDARIKEHPWLVVFYKTTIESFLWTLWPVAVIVGILYVWYCWSNQDKATLPYRAMPAMFKEEARLHKIKEEEKRIAREKNKEAWLLAAA